jgi:formate dehydrogenase subunit gamma
MSIFSKTVSKMREIGARHKAEAVEYYTHVDGVGSVPRDIYKYVKSNPLGDLPRYSPHIVIQHFLVFITFIILAATGLPIYFSDQFWAAYLVSFFGGIDTARVIHRVMAFIMIFAAAYHIITIVGGTIDKIRRHAFDYKRTQLPRLKDLFDLIHDIKYFLGRAPFRPKMEKFMYKQKAHYLAIIWGNFVLIAAGSVLLFPDIMARLFPETLGKILPSGGVGADSYSAFFQDLARLMHADEAVMALILLAFWHWTNVHLVPGRFPVQWAFLTGKITREHQIEEHFLEYLHNLRELPEEREYMKNLLKELGSDASKAPSTVGQTPSFSRPLDAAPGEKT